MHIYGAGIYIIYPIYIYILYIYIYSLKSCAVTTIVKSEETSGLSKRREASPFTSVDQSI